MSVSGKILKMLNLSRLNLITDRDLTPQVCGCVETKSKEGIVTVSSPNVAIWPDLVNRNVAKVTKLDMTQLSTRRRQSWTDAAAILLAGKGSARHRRAGESHSHQRQWRKSIYDVDLPSLAVFARYCTF